MFPREFFKSQIIKANKLFNLNWKGIQIVTTVCWHETLFFIKFLNRSKVLRMAQWVFGVHPSKICEYFILFYGWKRFYVRLPYFIYIHTHTIFLSPFISWWIFGLFFLLLWIINAVDTWVQAFTWTSVFISCRYIPRSKIPGSYGNSYI